LNRFASIVTSEVFPTPIGPSTAMWRNGRAGAVEDTAGARINEFRIQNAEFRMKKISEFSILNSEFCILHSCGKSRD